MNDPVLAQARVTCDSADVAVSDDAGCTDPPGAIRTGRGRVDAVEARVTSLDQAPSLGDAHAGGAIGAETRP